MNIVFPLTNAEAALCTFWGRAINYQTLQGIADMSVTIDVAAFKNSTKTFPDGYFTIDVLAPGSGYPLHFSHAHYKENTVVVNQQCSANAFANLGEIQFRPRLEFTVSQYVPKVVTFIAGKAKTEAITLLGNNLHNVGLEIYGCVLARVMDQPASGKRLVFSLIYNGSPNCASTTPQVTISLIVPGGTILQRDKLPLPIRITTAVERDQTYRRIFGDKDRPPMPRPPTAPRLIQ